MLEHPLEEEKVMHDCCFQHMVSKEEMQAPQSWAIMENICLVFSSTETAIQGMSSDITIQNQVIPLIKLFKHHLDLLRNVLGGKRGSLSILSCE